MNFRLLLGLLPLAIALHNLEEYRGFEAYARGRGLAVTRRQLQVALFLATLLPALLTLLSFSSRKQSAGMVSGLTVPAIFAANVASHVGQTLVWGDYSPGALTGVGLNLPLAAIIYCRAVREGYLTRSQLKRVIIWGSLLMAPAAALLQVIGWGVNVIKLSPPAPQRGEKKAKFPPLGG
jgi:hypothetical protein